VKDNFGQHPVIKMTLANVTGLTLNDVLDKFRFQLIQTCLKFEYVLGTLFFIIFSIYKNLDATKAKDDSGELGERKSSIFRSLQKAYDTNLSVVETRNDLSRALMCLTKIVSSHHEG
jgi:hypothetical protein